MDNTTPHHALGPGGSATPSNLDLALELSKLSSNVGWLYKNFGSLEDIIKTTGYRHKEMAKAIEQDLVVLTRNFGPLEKSVEQMRRAFDHDVQRIGPLERSVDQMRFAVDRDMQRIGPLEKSVQHVQRKTEADIEQTRSIVKDLCDKVAELYRRALDPQSNPVANSVAGAEPPSTGPLDLGPFLALPNHSSLLASPFPPKGKYSRCAPFVDGNDQTPGDCQTCSAQDKELASMSRVRVLEAMTEKVENIIKVDDLTNSVLQFGIDYNTALVDLGNRFNAELATLCRKFGHNLDETTSEEGNLGATNEESAEALVAHEEGDQVLAGDDYEMDLPIEGMD